MNNKLQTFCFQQNEVRILEIDGAPWFVGKDVAASLGYRNHNDALYKHVDVEAKGIANCDTLG